MADPRIDTFLRLMGSIETDTNPEAKHKTITSGMHAGDTAIGQYGLMPETIKTLSSSLSKKNPNDPMNELFRTKNKDTITQLLKDNLARRFEQLEEGDGHTDAGEPEEVL